MEYEDRVTISTPEGVELDLPLAGLGSRAIAVGLDLVVKALAIGLLALASLAGIGGDVGLAVVVIGAFCVLFGYDVLFEVLGSGRTPGKRATGLRVVTREGAPIGLRASAVRNILRFVDGPLTAYVAGSVAILASRHNQRLGDMAADALVLRERRAADRARPGAAAATAAAPVGAYDVSGISGGDLAAVRRFLERRSSLDPAARMELAERLAAALRSRVAGAPEGIGAEPFLEWLAGAKAARG